MIVTMNLIVTMIYETVCSFLTMIYEMLCSAVSTERRGDDGFYAKCIHSFSRVHNSAAVVCEAGIIIIKEVSGIHIVSVLED